MKATPTSEKNDGEGTAMDYLKAILDEKLFFVKMYLDDFAQLFDRECYYGGARPGNFKFPSFVTVGVRWLLRTRYVVTVIFAVLWVVAEIISIVAAVGKPIVEFLIQIVASALIFPIIIAVFLLALLLVLVLLMLVESLAKQICSLVLYEEWSCEMENPVDLAVCYLLNILPAADSGK